MFLCQLYSYVGDCLASDSIAWATAKGYICQFFAFQSGNAIVSLAVVKIGRDSNCMAAGIEE
jgi:hypothetical protein